MSKRQLTSHQVNGLNEALSIYVLDEPGQGNACHRYRIYPLELDTFDATNEPQRATALAQAVCDVHFQDGPIREVGINGISIEALLAIVEDRLIGFQRGPFSTRENSLALTHIQEAMMWLHKRTRDRVERAVEGTNKI